MATRTSLRMRGEDDSETAYRVAFETPWPRTMRKCTKKKNYAELDSDSEEDGKDMGIHPQGRDTKTRARTTCPRKNKGHGNDDDLIIDEQRSTPVPSLLGLAISKQAPKTQSEHKDGILRVAFNKSAQKALRAGRLFKSLPTEIHQHIIGYLPKDCDVSAYAQVCKIASQSVTNIIWRQRYARILDLPDDPSSGVVAKEYKIIRGISRKWSCFDEYKLRGRIHNELIEEQRINRPLCLSMLRTLIINSNARKGQDKDGNEVIIGLNHDYLRKVITPNDDQNLMDEVQFIDIMEAILNTDVNVFRQKMLSINDQFLLQIIQLCLTPMLLERDNWVKLRHFDLSQEMVYDSPYNQPLFEDEYMVRLNVQLCLATVNFFRFHLQHTGGEGLLAEEYTGLEPGQLPKAWLGRLQEGTQPLESHWKGAYTYMDQRDLVMFRSKANRHGKRHNVFVDNFDPLQDITMVFDQSKFTWPESFEKYYMTWPYFSTHSERTLRSSIRHPEIELDRYPMKSFFGSSRGQRDAHFFGRMHAIPPQRGIPGFQRITFLKFFHENGVYDPNSIWAYEGCVLPGNQIIVGRWWWIPEAGGTSDDDIPSGPFMFWNVDESHAEPPIDMKEAMEFYVEMRNHPAGL